ncbi:HU family DNA-binding protein [Sphingomonas sp. NFR15]|uniref:HU family DNA-binding protein n=1 Tax=Sphingomonas sp. NFR15 TaxID=1566282 RepID=UPI0008857321|nr:HU family DNA-binding protein [Sphingomonas sp. NFR15]SDA15155.1 DNA-binding protein HU-beta [Sphingomonas sp. NFR15]
MSKQALIDGVAATAGGTKADAAKYVDAVASSLHQIVAGGGRVILPPLGTFALKQKAARTARNPKTGETIQVAARQDVHLKPSKAR